MSDVRPREPAPSPQDPSAVGHPLAEALGIHPLVLPTPFAVGPITAWLLTDGPLTLIDTGVASAHCLHVLERRLAEHGRRIEDLEAIALTHEHADHVGLASIIVERSGAEVIGIDALAGRMADPKGYAKQETAFMVDALVRHGLSREMVLGLSSMQRAHAAWGGGPVRFTRSLASASQLRIGDLTFEVLLRPGHSVTDTLFVDHEHGLVIGGDHLLANVSSNPILACPPARLDPSRAEPPTADERVAALRDYLESLDRTAELAPDVVLGGHGPAVTNAVELIAERHRMHERRKRKILRFLAAEPGQTAHEIALKMWGDTAWKSPLLCISEVLGHLDLLLDDAAVVAVDDASVQRWSPV